MAPRAMEGPTDDAADDQRGRVRSTAGPGWSDERATELVHVTMTHAIGIRRFGLGGETRE